jgi:hypothetical protein
MMTIKLVLVATVIASFVGCGKAAPQSVLEDLGAMGKRDHVVIGRVSRTELELISVDPDPAMRRLLISETDAKIIEASSERLRAQTEPRENGDRRSPNGKWVVRVINDEYVLTQSSGEIKRTRIRKNSTLTPVRWSPHSEFLMWIEESDRFDLTSRRAIGDYRDVMIYRVRDGQTGRLYKVPDAYPFTQLDWLVLPKDLPAS